MASYRFIEEPRGGVGMEIVADTPPKVFDTAATALCLFMWEQETVAENDSIEISGYGFDRGTAALGLLSELLFRMDTDDWVFKRFETARLEEVDELDRRHRRRQLKITGRAYGERYDPRRHRARFPVRAVLLPKLKFQQAGSDWRLYCILDA